MATQTCASLLCTVSLLTLAAGSDFHAEHHAVHQTTLQRRVNSAKAIGKTMMRVNISEEEKRFINISTPLVDGGAEYIGTVGVGTTKAGKAQAVVQVVFDTGSTNLWVASTLCNSGPCDTERAKSFYDPVKSLSQEAFTKKLELDVHFGTGELKGPLHVDTYRVGPMVVKKQPFAMIRTMSSMLAALKLEGIVGLGFPSMSASGMVPFFDHVIEQKLLEHNEFAFFLHRDNNKPSALLWGGIDKDLYDGPVRMFPVIQPHYWALELVDLKVGNTSIKSAPKKVIVDTGTTEFTAPQHVMTEISRNVPHHNIPPLTYVLRDTNGKTYDLQIPKEVYLRDDLGGPSIAFMALDVPKKYGPALLLGEIFMRHYFTVFSRGDGGDKSAKVGFAPAKKGVNPKVKWPLSADMGEPSKTTPVFLDKSEQETQQPGLMRHEPEIQAHRVKL